MYDLIEEKELIEKTKAGDSNSLLKLTALHSGILAQQVKKCSLPYQTLANFNEFFSNRFEITYQTAQNWNPNRGKFNTFLGASMRYHCLRQMKKLIEKDEIYLNRDVVIEETEKNFSYIENEYKGIEDYLKLIEDKEIVIVLRLRYCNGLTWHEIGDICNRSHQWAQLKNNTGILIIKNKIEKERG